MCGAFFSPNELWLNIQNTVLRFLYQISIIWYVCIDSLIVFTFLQLIKHRRQYFVKEPTPKQILLIVYLAIPPINTETRCQQKCALTN